MITTEFLLGGWQLEISKILVRGRDICKFSPANQHIKFFAPQHFAVFNREQNRRPFSPELSDAERLAAAKNFDAAGGRYSLAGNMLTEHIDYASFPNYEGKSLRFHLYFDGIHLIQEGVYPLVSLGLSPHDGYLFQVYSRATV